MTTAGHHVLMPEVASTPAHYVAEALAHAGHAVYACHDTADTGLACAALRGQRCPLDDQPIDVAVLVRPGSRGEPTPVEQGAMCAARRRIPLVVGGAVEGDPYATWAAAEQDGTELVDLVDAVAAAPLPEHSRVATAALVESLRREAGGYEHCHAAVRRRAGTLKVMLSAEPYPTRRVRQAAGTRVHQRLRALDPWTSRVEISFSGQSGMVELDRQAG